MEIRILTAIFIICVVVFFVINKLCKVKSAFAKAFISAISGPLAMFILNFSSQFTGVGLPTSLFSMAASIIMGIPGIIAMLILNLFF